MLERLEEKEGRESLEKFQENINETYDVIKNPFNITILNIRLRCVEDYLKSYIKIPFKCVLVKEQNKIYPIIQIKNFYRMLCWIECIEFILPDLKMSISDNTDIPLDKIFY